MSEFIQLTGFAQWSYGSAALALGLFLLLLLSRWRGRMAGLPLVVAVSLNLLWALAAIYFHTDPANVAGAVGYSLLEVLRFVGWIWLLAQLWKPLLNADAQGLAFFLWLPRITYGVAALLLANNLSPDLRAALLSAGLPAHEAGMLALTLIALVLTEQLYRRTRPELRWAIKLLCLGLGSIFAFDFYLYSDALLFRRFDADIEAARGFLQFMAVPLLAVAVARNPQWSLELFISRRLVLRSVSVLAAGVYLLLMAAVGYYIRATDSDYGAALRIVFFAAAVLGLLVLAASGTVRARVRVFITKHFFQYQYDYRDEWLALMRTLSAGDQLSLPVRSIKALADIVDSPGGMLWTRDNGDQLVWREHWCLKPDTPPPAIDPQLVHWLEEKGWIIDLAEYRQHPERYDTLELPGWLFEIAHGWLIIPLLHGDRLSGIVLLASPRAPWAVNWEVRDLLKTAARQVAGYLVLYDTTLALVAAQQFEAFNRLSAFVVHDLKNVAAQLGLIVANAERHKHKPAFIDDMIHTVDNATAKMQRMLASLRKGSSDAATTSVVALPSVLADACEQTASRLPQAQITHALQVSVRADAERLTTVLVHLIQNAQDASDEHGSISISAHPDHNDVLIKISDNGCGMDAAFLRERLFRPFDTTKGNAGMGLGCYQARETIRSFGGDLTVISEPGHGTTFTLRLARADTDEKD